MKLDLTFIVESIQGRVLLGDINKQVVAVNTDSRKSIPGEIFFALPGERFDGHDFIEQALARGAVAVVLSDSTKIKLGEDRATLILVADVLEALHKLAASYRQLFDIPIIAVTGSVGKTTTKDLLAACLENSYHTLKTQGNFNNEIGLPLTLLKLNQDYQAAVVEMAMRAPKEISRLAETAQPNYAIITNVAPVHLETMGSLENIARAKCEVLDYITQEGFALINGDDELLQKTAQTASVARYTFGYGEECDIRIIKVENSGSGLDLTLDLLGQRKNFYFPVPAAKLVNDIAAAVGMAFLLGADLEQIRAGLAAFQLGDKRLNLISFPEGGAVIDDTYNANPLSMEAGLEFCQQLGAGRKTIAVLGDMLELGEYEVEGHILVGKKAAEMGMDVLVAIGQRAVHIAQGALENSMDPENVHWFPGREEAWRWIQGNISRRDLVFFKASRGMELDKLVQAYLSL